MTTIYYLLGVKFCGQLTKILMKTTQSLTWPLDIPIIVCAENKERPNGSPPQCWIWIDGVGLFILFRHMQNKSSEHSKKKISKMKVCS
jgi:hypothetical protein